MYSLLKSPSHILHVPVDNAMRCVVGNSRIMFRFELSTDVSSDGAESGNGGLHDVALNTVHMPDNIFLEVRLRVFIIQGTARQ